MRWEEVKKLTTELRNRIKKEAGDLECLTILRQKNPELAKLCSDIDDIINIWLYRQIKRMEKETPPTVLEE